MWSTLRFLSSAPLAYKNVHEDLWHTFTPCLKIHLPDRQSDQFVHILQSFSSPQKSIRNLYPPQLLMQKSFAQKIDFKK
uniref:Uncharacterized protein n=1 Tax=Anguilla anguilla TaxID=7936 RepID=A0A0E9UJV0_ANGAN